MLRIVRFYWFYNTLGKRREHEAERAAFRAPARATLLLKRPLDH